MTYVMTYGFAHSIGDKTRGPYILHDVVSFLRQKKALCRQVETLPESMSWVVIVGNESYDQRAPLCSNEASRSQF